MLNLTRRTLLATPLTLLAQPVPIVTKITGELHKLVLFSDGTIGGWGDARDGQLGPRKGIRTRRGHALAFVPINIPGKAMDIAASDNTSFVLLDNGTVLAFGSGAYGELGNGDTRLVNNEIPTLISGLSSVKSIAASPHAGFALHHDGTVSAWGARMSGMIGDNLFNHRFGEQSPSAYTPIRIPGLSQIAELAPGVDIMLAVTTAGKVISWGHRDPNIGRTWTGEERVSLPAKIPGLSGVAHALATTIAAAVLKTDGTVWVWGSNGQAEFGNGRRDDQTSLTPIRVNGVQGVKSLARGILGRHFLALQKDGQLRSWGNSDWGQTGNGITGQEQPSPATIKISGISAIFAAGNNSYAVKSDGSLWIWGNGLRGEWPLSDDTSRPVLLKLQ